MKYRKFMESCDRFPTAPTETDVDNLVEQFYLLPGNEAGGSLHIVLDDQNWERSSVEFCLEWAIGESDGAGVRMAEVLLQLTDEQLHEWLGPGRCEGCGVDYGDEHTGVSTNAADNRCSECGNWPAVSA